MLSPTSSQLFRSERGPALDTHKLRFPRASCQAGGRAKKKNEGACMLLPSRPARLPLDSECGLRRGGKEWSASGRAANKGPARRSDLHARSPAEHLREKANESQLKAGIWHSKDCPLPSRITLIVATASTPPALDGITRKQVNLVFIFFPFLQKTSFHSIRLPSLLTARAGGWLH